MDAVAWCEVHGIILRVADVDSFCERGQTRTMDHRKSIGLIGLFCLFLAASAPAQPRWGRDRLPDQGACFYEDVDFRGDYFCVRQGDRAAVAAVGHG